MLFTEGLLKPRVKHLAFHSGEDFKIPAVGSPDEPGINAAPIYDRDGFNDIDG